MAGVNAPRVVIVGAGPAGVRAAERLARAGLRPTIVDEGAGSGGQIYRRQPPGFRRTGREIYGFEAGKAASLHAALDALGPLVDHRPGTTAWSLGDGTVHLASEASGLEVIAFDAIVVASGATDRIMPLPGWTLPGAYTLGAAQIALKAQGCTIGRRPVFLGTGPLLTYAAHQYAAVGVPPVAIVDTSPFRNRIRAVPRLLARPAMLAKGLFYTAALAARGVPSHFGATPLRIEGDGRVEALAFTDERGRECRLACDAVVFGYGLRSETQLADLAGCRFGFDGIARQWLPEIDGDGRSSVPTMYLAGDGAAVRGADAAELAGRLAACAVLADAGVEDTTAERRALRARLLPHRRFREGLEAAFPWPARLAADIADETIVCRCESVTAGTLRDAVRRHGAAEQNRAKAFSRVGMGRCQGRYCGPAGAEILASTLQVPADTVGRLRGQSPVKPLPVGSANAG